MGNRNTSGIVEEKATTSDRRVGSTHDQEEEVENQTVIGEGVEEITDFQEKAAEKVSEEHQRSVNEDPETQTADLLDSSIERVEPKQTCFEEETSEFNDEMQDQPCTLKEEMQTSEIASSTPKSTSEIANPDSPSPLESADVTSESQEDHDTLAEEMIKSILLGDEKPTMNELDNDGERRSCVDQDTDHSAMIKSDDMDNDVEIGSNHGSDKVSLPDEKAPQEDEYISSSDETILENAVITTTKEQGNEYPTSDGCEKLGIGSSVPSLIGSRVELRKFPSFDFGLGRPEESDRTPLLYNVNSVATARSFSSRTSLPPRFQNRGVETEHYEAVEAEEKTIRMEISNSETSTMADLSLNQLNNNSDSDQEKGVGLEGSPPSTKGSGKRKPMSSSLFTTCMCCTAVTN